MKLCIVSPYFFPKMGGMENYALEICLRLKKTFKWDIFVITTDHETNTDRIVIHKGIKIYKLSYQFKISNTPVSTFWGNEIKKILKYEKPDIINGHFPVGFITDITERVRENIPFVLTYQNDLVKENVFINLLCKIQYLFFINRTLRDSNAIICTNQYYVNKSAYLRRYSEKIHIVPPGIDKTIFYPKTNSKKCHVLFVGQLDKTHQHKGLIYLLKAISYLKKIKLKINLVIIGTGNFIKNYQESCRSLDITDLVKFEEKCPTYKLQNYYSNAYCLILPSITAAEGFGMVMIEAAACKTLTIASNVGGIPNFISNNKNGLLIEPKNYHKIALSIKKIILNRKIRKELEENAYRSVIKTYDWDLTVKKTNLLFKSLI